MDKLKNITEEDKKNFGKKKFIKTSYRTNRIGGYHIRGNLMGRRMNNPSRLVIIEASDIVEDSVLSEDEVMIF